MWRIWIRFWSKSKDFFKIRWWFIPEIPFTSHFSTKIFLINYDRCRYKAFKPFFKILISISLSILLIRINTVSEQNKSLILFEVTGGETSFSDSSVNWLKETELSWPSVKMLLSVIILVMLIIGLNPFHATGLFRYPLKTLENLWFSDVFTGGIERDQWYEVG